MALPPGLPGVSGASVAALSKLSALAARRLGDRFVRIVVYGSRARGDFREDSDLDVAVVIRGEFPDHIELCDKLRDIVRLVRVDGAARLDAGLIEDTSLADPGSDPAPRFLRGVAADAAWAARPDAAERGAALRRARMHATALYAFLVTGNGALARCARARVLELSAGAPDVAGALTRTFRPDFRNAAEAFELTLDESRPPWEHEQALAPDFRPRPIMLVSGAMEALAAWFRRAGRPADGIGEELRRYREAGGAP